MGQDLESIRNAVRRSAETPYHPTGTCKTGNDNGNTNAPTIAIAEKAADLIRG